MAKKNRYDVTFTVKSEDKNHNAVTMKIAADDFKAAYTWADSKLGTVECDDLYQMIVKIELVARVEVI